MNRLDARFAALKAEGRAAFVSFVTAGDPRPDISADILAGLPAAGADIIELGMPFSDPSADGPAIDRASQRAIAAGQKMAGTLDMVKTFRTQDDATPIVLMGYFNPILAYGIDRFVADAKTAGVDGFILVDLPPEEDAELREPLQAAGLHLVRLATPTSDEKRLQLICAEASGFVYYVAVAGVTGQKSADANDIEAAVARIKAVTDVPVCVGFGIKTPEAAAAVARVADGAVVGTAIVSVIEAHVEKGSDAENGPEITANVLDFTASLANGVKTARA